MFDNPFLTGLNNYFEKKKVTHDKTLELFPLDH